MTKAERAVIEAVEAKWNPIPDDISDETIDQTYAPKTAAIIHALRALNDAPPARAVEMVVHKYNTINMAAFPGALDELEATPGTRVRIEAIDGKGE